MVVVGRHRRSGRRSLPGPTTATVVPRGCGIDSLLELAGNVGTRDVGCVGAETSAPRRRMNVVTGDVGEGAPSMKGAQLAERHQHRR